MLDLGSSTGGVLGRVRSDVDQATVPVVVVPGEGREDRGDAVGAAPAPPPRRPQPGPLSIKVKVNRVVVGVGVVGCI